MYTRPLGALVRRHGDIRECSAPARLSFAMTMHISCSSTPPGTSLIFHIVLELVLRLYESH